MPFTQSKQLCTLLTFPINTFRTRPAAGDLQWRCLLTFFFKRRGLTHPVSRLQGTPASIAPRISCLKSLLTYGFPV